MSASSPCSSRSTCRAIGTREAVRRYDTLLGRGDDLRWLRSQRNRIAAEVLLATGAVAAPAAAAAACVPLFSPVN